MAGAKASSREEDILPVWIITLIGWGRLCEFFMKSCIRCPA